MPPLTLRIFVSSPGDVAEERVIAQRVIERLQREYAGHLTLEPILWEHEPLLATYGWQHQIPLPHDCDIVICILWSRLGTRLPGDITRPDGSRYESGTAYEFEDALEGFHQRGKPDLVVYRKMAPPTLNLEHVEEVLHRLEQKQALDTFIDKWFSDTEEGVSKTPYHPFTNSSQFEELVLKHLRKLCDRHLARAAGEGNGGVEPVLPSRVVWTQGSPFRGLEVFEPEHAEIFCGRTRAVGEVLQALRRQIAQGRAFVLVVGASGAGKSSLVRAGVLPLLIQPGVMEGVGLWRWAIFKPSDSGGDLIEALASALLRPEALPELATDGTGVPELAAMLRSTPQAAAALVKGALSQAAASKQTQDRLDHQPEARLVLVVDQMEEIFTRERILPEHRLAFVEIVASLAKGGRACILATLRSDLYPRTQDIPPLLELKAGDGLYDLVPPLAAEIGQMIREPAHAAGLTFEVHPKTGVALDDLLLNASVTHPGNLPLLEFTLAALYERRTPAGLLTHQAYEELGGLEGAIAHRAEETFRVLKPETQAAFGRIFRHLVSLGSGEEETIARQPATMADLVHTPQGREFVERFVEARLFTSGQGDDGVPVVTIAHEALLRHWPRLQGWLEEDRELLRIKSRVQAAAGRWAAEGRPGDLLLPAGKLLDEARVLQHADSGLGEVELAFLRSSVVRAEHQRRTKQLGVVMLAVFGLLSALLAVFAFRANTQTRVALGQAEQQRHETERERLLGLAREGILYADQGRARTARDRLVEAATGLTPDGHLPDWLTVAFWDLFRRQPLPLFEKVGGRTSWNIGLSPDGRRALTISADQTQAQLWDTISGQVLRTFTATSPLDSATLSPDGTLAVASAEDSTVYVWDAATGEQRWSFKEGDATLLDMSFSHDGRYLLGGGVDEVAWLWDLETGALERRYPTPGYALYAVALSPDGRWVATGVNQAVDGLTLWNRAAAKPVAHLQGHGAGVFGINFTPDSRRLVSSSYDRTVRVWSVPGAAPVRTIEAHVHSVDQVRVLHDGRRALSLGRDGTIKLWDLETGALQRTWTGDPAAFFVFAVDATATHMVTVGHGGHMQLWGLGAEPSTLDLRRNSPEVALTHAHADPAGRWVVAVYDDGLVELRDVATGYLLKRYPSMGFRPMRTALDHAGRRLAVLSTEAVLKIIDIGTGTVAGPYEVGLGDRDICRPQGAAFTPDDATLLIASGGNQAEFRSNGGIRSIDVATGDTHWTITEPYRGSNPMSVTLDPSGQRFAAGSNEGKLIFGTVADGKVTASRDMPMSVLGALTWPSPERLLIGGSDRTITTINPDTGAPPVALPGHRGRVRSLALLADGHTLVSRGEREPQLRVWDLESGRDLVHLPVTSEDLVPLVVNEAKTTWVVDNDVWRLDRAAEYLELTPIVPAAAARLAGQPGNAEALRTLGRWCHLRGDWAWAAEHLEEARKVGAAVDPLMLGQCYWQLGRTDDATQELQASLEATNDGAQRWYLQRCLEALQAPPGS